MLSLESTSGVQYHHVLRTSELAGKYMPCVTSWDVKVSKGKCFFVYHATFGGGNAREKEPIENHDKLNMEMQVMYGVCSCKLVTYCRFVHRVGEIPYRACSLGYIFCFGARKGAFLGFALLMTSIVEA